ncbi:hypothetical protein BN1195_00339 [Chryseobacterium oranimense G311]|nr:hypothetical protein BN1195_00339 [Chryseobacterium oranimense G311]
MKKILLAATISFGISAMAQEVKPEAATTDTVKAWSIQGQNTLMLNQAAFSNWVGGGANNVAGLPE